MKGISSLNEGCIIAYADEYVWLKAYQIEDDATNRTRFAFSLYQKRER